MKDGSNSLPFRLQEAPVGGSIVPTPICLFAKWGLLRSGFTENTGRATKAAAKLAFILIVAILLSVASVLQLYNSI